MDFQKSKTKENLARSFAAECQEGARYQFVAKMALQQELPYLSAIIRTLAHNEMAHAKQFFQMINKYSNGEVQNIDISAGFPYKGGELAETLLLEAKNEKSSAENIYPTFALIAQDEGYADVSDLFNMVAQVEKSHEKVLTQLHQRLKNSKLYKSTNKTIFKCDECGHQSYDKSAPKTCPLCKMAQGYYRIDLSLT